MNYAEESLKLHYQWKGKLDTIPKMKVSQKALNPPATAPHRRFSHKEYYKKLAIA